MIFTDIHDVHIDATIVESQHRREPTESDVRSPRAPLPSLDAHVILERATRHARIFFWFGWWRVAYAMQYSLFNFNKVYFPLEIQD